MARHTHSDSTSFIRSHGNDETTESKVRSHSNSSTTSLHDEEKHQPLEEYKIDIRGETDETLTPSIATPATDVELTTHIIASSSNASSSLDDEVDLVKCEVCVRTNAPSMDSTLPNVPLPSDSSSGSSNTRVDSALTEYYVRITHTKILPRFYVNPSDRSAHLARLAALPPLPSYKHSPYLPRKLIQSTPDFTGEQIALDDSFSSLPNDLLFHTMTFLSGAEMAYSCPPISRHLLRLSNDRVLWSKLVSQSYHLPPSHKQRPRDYYIGRYAEELGRVGKYTIPEMSNEYAKHPIRYRFLWWIFSGWTDIAHASFWLIWCVLFGMRVGGHIDYQWIYVFLPTFLSLLLTDINLVGYAILALRQHWWISFQQDILQPLRGIIVGVVQSLLLPSLLNPCFAPGTRSWEQTYPERISRLDGKSVTMTCFLFGVIQFGWSLLVYKLEYEASCETACVSSVSWIAVTFILLLPTLILALMCHLMYWIYWGMDWRRIGFPITIIELAGAIITIFMVAHSQDAFRSDLASSSSPSSLPFYAASQWSLYCFLPIWLSHTIGTFGVIIYVLIHTSRGGYGFFSLFVMIILGSLLFHAPVLPVEIMLYFTFDRQWRHVSDIYDTSPQAPPPLPPISSVDLTPSIDPSDIAVPFLSVIGCFFLCIFCLLGIGSLSARNRRYNAHY